LEKYQIEIKFEVMKNILICAFFFFLSLGISISSVAQGLAGHVGVTLPYGDFGDSNEKWGGAAKGPQIGIQYLWDIRKVKGVMFSLGVDAMYNGLGSDIKDYWQGSPNYFSKTHEFINVPVTAGLRYVQGLPNIWFLKFRDKLAVYAEAGAGPDFLKITDDAKYYSQKEDYIRGYKLSTRFGYKVGAGLSYKGKYYLGLNYYGLGTQDVKYKKSSSNSSTVSNVKINQLSLTLGVNFRAFKGK